MLSAVAMPPLFFAGAMPGVIFRKHGFRMESGGMAAALNIFTSLRVNHDSGAIRNSANDTRAFYKVG